MYPTTMEGEYNIGTYNIITKFRTHHYNALLYNLLHRYDALLLVASNAP